ncbi:MAG: hypothetical protein JWP89_417 [Schlesneria sp.]|nr:hypothetical protein [Schlesneria sp.]
MAIYCCSWTSDCGWRSRYSFLKSFHRVAAVEPVELHHPPIAVAVRRGRRMALPRMSRSTWVTRVSLFLATDATAIKTSAPERGPNSAEPWISEPIFIPSPRQSSRPCSPRMTTVAFLPLLGDRMSSHCEAQPTALSCVAGCVKPWSGCTLKSASHQKPPYGKASPLKRRR